MKLTIRERLIALSLLPNEGNILYLRARQELNGKLNFSLEEIEKYGIKQEGEQILWQDVPDEFEIDITPAEKQLIAQALREKDEAEKLNEESISLYDKFV